MAAEQEIRVVQIWRRKNNGRLIRIVRANHSYQGVSVEDWVWRGHDYSGRGFSYGSYIRENCDLVEPEHAETED